MINFTPIGKKFLVRQIKAPTTSVGGIIISTKQHQDLHEGQITAIGKGYDSEESPVQVGDRVLLTKWVKHEELKDDSNSYMVIDTDSIIAILRD